MTLAYNNLEDRMQQSYAGNMTTYLFDIASYLPQVLADGDSTYLYGLGRIGEEGIAGWQYHHGDALGSVRQLTNLSGAATLAKSYEPYGELLNSAGDVDTPYDFAGEWRDNTGLIYLRARFYEPYLNQFIQRDPIVPDPYKPWEWNRYIYSRNNPVNFTDPSGTISCHNGDNPDCQISARLVKQFALATKSGVINGAILPVEGFAQTVDFAYWLFGNDYRGMAWALTHVINGFDPNAGSVWIQVIRKGDKSPYYINQDWLPYKHNPQHDDPFWGGGETGRWIHSLRGDWREEYWDKTANQAYHFWFFAAVAFFDGTAWATLGNLVHDPAIKDYDFINSPEDEPPPPSGISKPDYQLGLKGRELGSKMRKEYLDFYISLGYCHANTIPPLPPLSFDPGSWIRANLK